MLSSNLALPPDKEALEREIAGLLGNGDFTTLARLIHRDYSQVTRSFSTTDDTRLNPVFQIILHLWAFDSMRRELGDMVIAIILRERDKWLCGEAVVTEHPAKLTKRIGLELFQAIECEMKDDPVDDQIREWNDVRNRVNAKLNSLHAKRVVQKYGGNVQEMRSKAS